MLNRIHSGFSLVELIIGMAIIAMLMALALPQYTTFISNSRLRATAEGITNGLNLARAEAVKRNGRVELAFTDDEPIEPLVNSITLATITTASGIPALTSNSWMVRAWVPTTSSYDFVEGKLGAEGSGKTGASGVIITPVTAGIFDGTVTFTGFGAMNSAQGISFQVTFPTAGACDTVATQGPLRCLNVNVTPGGQIRICDPKITAANDTRAC
jgi:type IV fimbrial biogenesis protein FimT